LPIATSDLGGATGKNAVFQNEEPVRSGKTVFWLANRLNSWFHGRGMWKAITLLCFTLGLFVIPLIIGLFVHTQQLKNIGGILSGISMILNMFLIIYVRQICYDMKDKRVKKYFDEKWMRILGGGFIHVSLIGQSRYSMNVFYHRSWDMEEVVYYPGGTLAYYEKIEVHPTQLFALQPASKRDIRKHDLDVKLAKAFLAGPQIPPKRY
jgi:hypothetical protein